MDKKKFLFVTLDALIADTAWQILKEGHEVKFYAENDEDKEVGDGFIPKVDDWKKEVDWADIIVFDDVLGQGKKAEALRKAGKLVIGGTAYTDRLEDDRAFGQEELKKIGVPIIAHENFTSFDGAIAYVQANPGRYVVKSSGEAQNMKTLLYVGEEETGKDVLYILDAYKKAWSKEIRSFQLQKRILGVEVAVGAFFNGKEFVYPINVNFEHKKLFPGDLGPHTGEMGTLMFWSEPNNMFNSTLKKMEPKFAAEVYVWYVDLNCIVNSYGVYPLEFTARFGYPTIVIQQEGILMPIGEFLYGLAEGSFQRFKAKSGFQIGVRIVVPPFPFKDPKTFEVNSKDAVVLFKKQSTEGIHIEDVKLVNDEWIITGTSGVILVVVGTGPTVKQTQKNVYNKVENIMLPNMYYRTDIGDRWSEDSDRLHNWGYLRET